MDVDMTTSQEEGEGKVFFKKKLLEQLGGEEQDSLHEYLNDSKQFALGNKQFRSNSECLHCTGQAVESLLDDPDFMREFDQHKQQNDQSEEDEYEFDNEMNKDEDEKLNIISRINYD